MIVWIAITCPGCHSTDVIKNGKTPHGKPGLFHSRVKRGRLKL